jgi:hypothetical protein
MADPVTMMMIGSTVLSAGGQYRAGKTEDKRAKIEARQMEAQAKEEFAASQRAGFEQERQGALKASRMLALAAASGGGASDPTIVNLMANLAGETQYRKSVELYEGGERAKDLRYQGQVRRYEGKEAKRAGKLGAFTTLLSGGTSLYSKYGMKPSA